MRPITVVNANTKKKWLTELFLGTDWNKGEVCKCCYSDPPSWSSYEGGVDRCDYCSVPKYGNTVAPWYIPEKELKRLMKENVWK